MQLNHCPDTLYTDLNTSVTNENLTQEQRSSVGGHHSMQQKKNKLKRGITPKL